MKAFFIVDEITHLHWDILKSLILSLVLLPMCTGLLNLWQSTEGGSQIVIGFFALTVLSAWLILCFLSALKVSVWQLHHMQTQCEQYVFKLYRIVPMLFLSGLVAYLSISCATLF